MIHTISVLVAVSVLASALVPAALAQTVDAEVSVLDGSMLVKFTNTTGALIEQLTVWFTSEHTVQSYTLEPGWAASDTTTSVVLRGSLDDGEVVRLGVKFDGADPEMAWQAVLQDGTTATGWVVTQPRPQPDDAEPDTQPDTPIIEPDPGILPESQLRIIPDRPVAGSPIRIAGEGFGPSHDIWLSVDGTALDRVRADESGRFVVTQQLPPDLSGRVDFEAADSLDNLLQISLRVEGARTVPDVSGMLSVGVGETHLQGSVVEIAGTSQPLGVVVVAVHGPDGSKITTASVSADAGGVWGMESILIPLDAALGEYTILAEDGTRTAQDTFVVESGKTIMLEAGRAIFDEGTPLVFRGTAEPDTPLRLLLLDPTGSEVTLDLVDVGGDGEVEWRFPTALDSARGDIYACGIPGGPYRTGLRGCGNARGDSGYTGI